MAGAIVASVFMFTWMTEYSDDTSDQLIRTFENEQECNSVSVEIRACQEIARNILNVNATNRGQLKLNQIIFRLYDASDGAITRKVNVSIRPNTKKSFPVIRQDAVVTVEAIPVLFRTDGEIICTKRATTLNSVGIC